MLAHRLRLWANFKSALGHRLVFAALASYCTSSTAVVQKRINAGVSTAQQTQGVNPIIF